MLENPLPLSPHFLPRPPASGASTSTSTKQQAQAAAAKGARQQHESEDGDLFSTPAELICPITHAVYSDPVLTAAGHVYERAAIETHLTRSDTDPLTRQRLLNRSLTPVFVLKSKAQEYRESCARRCVERACAAGSAERAVRLLRRACELAGEAPPGAPAVQGLPPATVAYVQSHASNAYDRLALQAFAQGLYDGGYRDRAAAVYHVLLSGDADRAQQAELLKRCLACWTAGAGGSGADCSGGGSDGGCGALVPSGSPGPPGSSAAPQHADGHVFEKLVQLFEGGGGSGQQAGPAFSWPQIIDVASEAGLGDEFAIRLCEQLLFAPAPGGLSAGLGGRDAPPAGSWPREKEILLKYVSVLTQGLKRRQGEAEARLSELDRWRRQLGGSSGGGGSRGGSGASSPRGGGSGLRARELLLRGRRLPRWMSHPLLLGSCTLVGVVLSDNHPALRVLRALPVALLVASQQH